MLTIFTNVCVRLNREINKLLCCKNWFYWPSTTTLARIQGLLEGFLELKASFRMLTSCQSESRTELYTRFIIYFLEGGEGHPE